MLDEVRGALPFSTSQWRADALPSGATAGCATHPFIRSFDWRWEMYSPSAPAFPIDASPLPFLGRGSARILVQGEGLASPNLRDEPMARLDGTAAIVTGAAQGIGATYAKALAAEGAR